MHLAEGNLLPGGLCSQSLATPGLARHDDDWCRARKAQAICLKLWCNSCSRLAPSETGLKLDSIWACFLPLPWLPDNFRSALREHSLGKLLALQSWLPGNPILNKDRWWSASQVQHHILHHHPTKPLLPSEMVDGHYPSWNSFFSKQLKIGFFHSFQYASFIQFCWRIYSILLYFTSYPEKLYHEASILGKCKTPKCTLMSHYLSIPLQKGSSFCVF